ncbi:MAG: DUF1302 domain-containing protein, partial [Rhodobacteraceae bacterium]|nr:DUF1302 domain-containing protein [Paracoccaceae bacterium]
MRNAPGRAAAGRSCTRTKGKWKSCRQGRNSFSKRITCSLALTLGGIVIGGILQVPPASAIEFDNGELWGSIDTTLSHGLTFRVQKRNDELAGDINGNDGNLNYKRGLVSDASKLTIDLDINTNAFGAFVRTTGFMDFENLNRIRERTPLSEAAKDAVGKDFELLDAYVTTEFEAGDAYVDLRLGKHVLNWGESTFIPNGINAINPFDVSKLRLPGSELREALLPVSMVSVSVAPTYALSLEAFYQLDWAETEIDPVGSYFSSTDYAGPGATKAVLTTVMEGLIPGNKLLQDRGFGFGDELTAVINTDLSGYTVMHPQLGTVPLPQPDQPEFDPNFASVLRGPDQTPKDTGQLGLALRYLAEELNQTEFGFYFMNYHSRLPVVGARTGSLDGIRAGLAAADAVTRAGAATRTAVTAAVTNVVRASVPQGTPQAAIEKSVRDKVTERLGGIAGALAVDRYAKSGHYFLEYPSDIKLIGVSMNTVLGASGWALQGEYSLRLDAPLQRAEREVLAEGLAPIGTALFLSGCIAGTVTEEDGCPPGGQQVAQAALDRYLNAYEPTKVLGYIERNVSQLQATATKVFGPTLGADALVFLAEAAVMRVHNMPDKQEFPIESPAGGVRATGTADADAASWGYRIAARLDYNNAIGAFNLYPYTQFLHDVSGNSPA